MSQLQELLKWQKSAISELQEKVKNFEKDGAAKQDVPYFERRLVRLEDWYVSFKHRNKKIEKLKKPATDKDQPYFTQNSYQGTKAIFTAHKKQLRDGLFKLTGETYDETLDKSVIDHPPHANEANDQVIASTVDQNANAAGSTSIENHAQMSNSTALINNNENITTILSVLFDDVNEILTTINEMTGNESAGFAKANSDLLREA